MMPGQQFSTIASTNNQSHQVLSGIRTVASLNSEEIEIKRYATHLDGAYAAGVKEGLAKGIGNGSLFMAFYCSYALAFWFGTKQVRTVFLSRGIRAITTSKQGILYITGNVNPCVTRGLGLEICVHTRFGDECLSYPRPTNTKPMKTVGVQQ